MSLKIKISREQRQIRRHLSLIDKRTALLTKKLDRLNRLISLRTQSLWYHLVVVMCKLLFEVELLHKFPNNSKIFDWAYQHRCVWLALLDCFNALLNNYGYFMCTLTLLESSAIWLCSRHFEFEKTDWFYALPVRFSLEAAIIAFNSILLSVERNVEQKDHNSLTRS